MTLLPEMEDPIGGSEIQVWLAANPQSPTRSNRRYSRRLMPGPSMPRLRPLSAWFIVRRQA